MVSPHNRKTGKVAGSRKIGRAVSVQIRTSIPFDKNAVVTRTEVTRKVKRRVVTKSTPVAVPVIFSTPLVQAPADSPLSDQDDTQSSGKQERKGPSRSVAVCRAFFLLYLTIYLTKRLAHAVKP